MADEEFTPEELELLDEMIADLKALNRRLSNRFSAGEKNSIVEPVLIDLPPIQAIQSEAESTMVMEHKDEQLEDLVKESPDLVHSKREVHVMEPLNNGGLVAGMGDQLLQPFVPINQQTKCTSSNFVPGVFLSNRLLDLYTQCDSLVDAQKVFDEMGNKDLCPYWVIMLGLDSIEPLLAQTDELQLLLLAPVSPRLPPKPPDVSHDSAWEDMLPKRFLREDHQHEWSMMYRKIKNLGVFSLLQGFLKEVPLQYLRLQEGSIHAQAQNTNLEYLLMLDVGRLIWSFRKTASLATPPTPYTEILLIRESKRLIGSRCRKRSEMIDELPADKRAWSSLNFRASSSNSSVQTHMHSTPAAHDHDMDTSSSASASSRPEREQEKDSAYGSCDSDDMKQHHSSLNAYHRGRVFNDHGKFKNIISSLSGQTEPSGHLAVLTEPCELLSFCTEGSLSSMTSGLLSPLLVNLAKHESNPNIMLFSIRAITYICDLYPRSAAFLVHCDVVPALCQILLAIEYQDVVDQCLQALEKISQEQPLACLQAGIMMVVLTHIDFFSTSIQRVAHSTVVNICQKLPLESPSHFMDVVQILCHLLQYEDRQLVENVANCLIKIVERVAKSSAMLDLDENEQGLIWPSVSGKDSYNALVISPTGFSFKPYSLFVKLIAVRISFARWPKMKRRKCRRLNMSSTTFWIINYIRKFSRSVPKVYVIGLMHGNFNYISLVHGGAQPLESQIFVGIMAVCSPNELDHSSCCGTSFLIWLVSRIILFPIKNLEHMVVLINDIIRNTVKHVIFANFSSAKFGITDAAISVLPLFNIALSSTVHAPIRTNFLHFLLAILLIVMKSLCYSWILILSVVRLNNASNQHKIYGAEQFDDVKDFHQDMKKLIGFQRDDALEYAANLHNASINTIRAMASIQAANFGLEISHRTYYKLSSSVEQGSSSCSLKMMLSFELSLEFSKIKEDMTIATTITAKKVNSIAFKSFNGHNLEDKVTFKGNGIVTNRNASSAHSPTNPHAKPGMKENSVKDPPIQGEAWHCCEAREYTIRGLYKGQRSTIQGV